MDTVEIVEGPVKVAIVAIVGVVDTVGIVETPSKVASVANAPDRGNGRDGRR